MRAVDELITLKTKVCRPVSRRLSIIERRDPLCNSLTHKFQPSEKIRVAAQEVSKSGFFWNDETSKHSLIVKQRFKNTSSRPIVTEEVFKSWMKWSSLKEEKFFVLIKETNNFDEINNFFYEQLLKQNWDLREAHEKSLNEMEELKRFQGSTFDGFSRKKIGRRSRYYPCTHRQDSGITEWNQLYEWFERFSRCWISTQWTFPSYQSTCVFTHLIQILVEC